MDKQVTISYKTIVFAFFFLLAAYIVYRLGPVIGLFLVSLVIVFSVEPLIKKIMKLVVLNRNVSRTVSVFITYILLVILLVFIITVGVPPFIAQIQKLVRSLSGMVVTLDIAQRFNIQLSDLLPQASKISEGLITTAFSIFSNFTTLMTLLIFSLYMSLDWENIKKKFLYLFPEEHKLTAKSALDEVELSMGSWVKGQFLLMNVVGIMSFIGLVILDVEYAPALGLISGLLEIVPMLGPILSAVIAAFVAFADSPVKGLGVIALYIVVQQLENNILVPKVMQKVSGFSPLVILLALMVGSEFFGIMGAVLAVPITMVLTIILKKALRFETYTD